MKIQLGEVKKQLEQAMIFNATSPLTIFETQKYTQNEPKLNDVFQETIYLK